MPAVVFVTAYDKYAIQAFEVNAVDYLLKPFDESRLRASIERARERLSRPSALVRQLEGLIEAHEAQWVQRLVVRSGERFDFVPVDSIDWIESANNYTVLHCRSKDYVFGENLSTLEQRLDPGRFCRVHRCHIVNVTRIVAANAIAGGVYRARTARRPAGQDGPSIQRQHPQDPQRRTLSAVAAPEVQGGVRTCGLLGWRRERRKMRA